MKNNPTKPINKAAGALLSALLVFGSAPGAFAQVAATAVRAGGASFNGAAAGAAALSPLQGSGINAASSLGGLQSGLPSLGANAALQIAPAAMSPGISPASLTLPRNAAKTPGIAPAKIAGTVGSSKKIMTARTGAISRTLRDLPKVEKASSNQAFGIGSAIQNALTGARSIKGSGSVSAAVSRLFGRGPKANTGLRRAPNGVSEDKKNEVPAPGSREAAATEAEVQEVADLIARLKAEVGRVIIGQEEMVDSIVQAMIAREHINIEGLPGVAKTATVEAFAGALGADFQIVQGTPDKDPQDILGAEILQETPDGKVMKLEKGPIFAMFVLIDEINRMKPITQSALLQAMQSRKVTIGRETLKLPEPFLLMATQNPIEQEGTYPLPEAQQDRFMYKIVVPQPGREDRKKINELNRKRIKVKTNPVTTIEDFARATEIAERVRMDESIRDYIQDILDAALDPSSVGVGEPGLVEVAMITRASIFMEKAARINALMAGRTFVTPEDVKTVAAKILRHRIIPSYAAVETTVDQLVQAILGAVPVP